MKCLWAIVKAVLRPVRDAWRRWYAAKVFRYDARRFFSVSGYGRPQAREQQLANVILHYHVIEKGLTMPNRRDVFGREALKELLGSINQYVTCFGLDDTQVTHAIGVVKTYVERNANQPGDPILDEANDFLGNYPDVPSVEEPHLTREAFYRGCEGPFPEFARARHTLRHYAPKELTIERLRSAVELCRTTPTACNRQYCRVYCVSDKETIEKILEIQHGNRGFGHLASKLLVLVSDLEGIASPLERDDGFTNGGLFLMNLCYALYYHKIAHCILNWSRTPEEDLAARRLIPIKPSETIVAVLTCGETPDEVEMCASPRRPLEDIFKVI